MGLWRAVDRSCVRRLVFRLKRVDGTKRVLGASGMSRDGRLHRMRRILALRRRLPPPFPSRPAKRHSSRMRLSAARWGRARALLSVRQCRGAARVARWRAPRLAAGSGALIGSAATPSGYYGGPPPRRCAQWAYDYNGNRVCTAFY